MQISPSVNIISTHSLQIESWRNRLALRRSQNYQSSSPAMSSSLLSGSSSLLPQQDKDSDGRDTPPSSISTLGSTHQPEADSCVMWPGQGPIDTVWQLLLGLLSPTALTVFMALVFLANIAAILYHIFYTWFSPFVLISRYIFFCYLYLCLEMIALWWLFWMASC